MLKAASWFSKLRAGLTKSRDHITKKLATIVGRGKIDEDLYEELESLLLSSDVGYHATTHLLDLVRQSVNLKGLKNSDELYQALKISMLNTLLPLERPPLAIQSSCMVDANTTNSHVVASTNKSNGAPFVIMVAGVNGAGKTTSIGKLAKYFQNQGLSVLLAAGDTFRAAASEQLLEWGRENNVKVVASKSSDSASICFDAIHSAIASHIDVVIADTAGRLSTQLNLMEEIKKVKRVINKTLPDAPHEVLLVLDGTLGQNTLAQVKAFDAALGLTGLIVTKLDGSSKGGFVFAIAKECPVALRFIGVGEGIDDLKPFVAKEYVEALC